MTNSVLWCCFWSAILCTHLPAGHLLPCTLASCGPASSVSPVSPISNKCCPHCRRSLRRRWNPASPGPLQPEDHNPSTPPVEVSHTEKEVSCPALQSSASMTSIAYRADDVSIEIHDAQTEAQGQTPAPCTILPETGGSVESNVSEHSGLDFWINPLPTFAAFLQQRSAIELDRSISSD